MNTDPAVTAAAEALTHYALPAYIAEAAVAAARPVIEAEVRAQVAAAIRAEAVLRGTDYTHDGLMDAARIAEGTDR